MSQTPPRIAIIGAASTRQGLGPYMANHLHQFGADICAILGTTEVSTRTARDDLKKRFQLDPTPYTNIEDLLSEQEPDAIVIASPHASHLHYLETALLCGAHVLCEKPFIWNCAQLEDTCTELIRRYQQENLVLMEHVQWPCTLPAYFSLFPEAATPTPPENFTMHLAPASQGKDRIIDTFSHVFSMLGRLIPDLNPQLNTIQFKEDNNTLNITFDYIHFTGTTQVSVMLQHCPEQPRPAGYGINGHNAQRSIRMPDYTMSFTAESTPENNNNSEVDPSVPLPDPMQILLKEFMNALQQARTGGKIFSDAAIRTRIVLLDHVLQAYAENFD